MWPLIRKLDIIWSPNRYQQDRRSGRFARPDFYPRGSCAYHHRPSRPGESCRVVWVPKNAPEEVVGLCESRWWSKVGLNFLKVSCHSLWVPGELAYHLLLHPLNRCWQRYSHRLLSRCMASIVMQVIHMRLLHCWKPPSPYPLKSRPWIRQQG